MGTHHYAASVLTAILTVTITATPTTAAPAEPQASAQHHGIRITRIAFDPPGNDLPVTNAKLNGEWIRITNHFHSARKITGWKVRDASGHVYKFGTLKLGAGKSVRLHTGRGTNTKADRYWRLDNYVWNNSGDTAVLKNAAGTVVDRCTYNGAGSATSC
ncbi:lamin tail domain-containing protein [Nocardioides speluncae]|uniref:lamin tail domain-containing protein n=1 Tax=Nocardioides speluncae TaxID=2670337 RepID=UPI000D695369|nr:lamin tail domain-containing protein [Nocardioides speluncae]